MRLLVIDGNSIVNRAFYGIKLLTTKDGQFTNGIYGFLNILIKLRQECDPDAVAVAFDLKAPTFRHKMYSGYKAGRKGMPDELRSQMPILKELLGYLGYVIVEKEGYEADDILGTLSAQCKGDDRCFIATGDRDSLQLISDNTNVLLAATKMGKAVTVNYDRQKLMEEYGVEPSGMIEIKALQGDSSDNIPGVAGVGPKTAGELIQKYGNIDYIYENLDSLDIKKGVHDKLLNDKENAFLSRTLGTICLEAPVDTNLESYRIAEIDSVNAIKLLVKLEMFGIIEKLGLTAQSVVHKEDEKPVSEIAFAEQRDLPALLGKLKKQGEAYFITDYADGRIKSMYFCVDSNVEYVPADCFDFDSFFSDFVSGEWKKHTTDLKALYKYALSKGLNVVNAESDTSVMGYILNPSANSYDADRLFEEYGIAAVKIECDEQHTSLAYSAARLPALCDKLHMMIKENSQDKLLYEIELPLCEVLASMENDGFLVDKKGIEAFGEKMSVKVEELTQRIYEQAGFEFNINSPKQLGAALFERLGLPCKKKTKSGYSTNADVLEGLADEYPIVADVLEYRTLAKLKSTYCEGLLKVIGED